MCRPNISGVMLRHSLSLSLSLYLSLFSSFWCCLHGAMPDEGEEKSNAWRRGRESESGSHAGIKGSEGRKAKILAKMWRWFWRSETSRMLSLSQILGRSRSANQKFVRARSPQYRNAEVFDQTRCSRAFACRICPEYHSFRGQKINANFFCTKFFENPSGHGRPRRKSCTSAPKVHFSAAPVMGRNFLTQGRPGVRVRNVRGKSGPKSLCLCCFFFPDHFESITFLIQKPFNHVAAIAEKSWEFLRGNSFL